MRRGVEVADAGRMRVAHERDRLVVGDRAEEVAQRRAAEAQRPAIQSRLQPRIEHAGVLIGWMSWQVPVGRPPALESAVDAAGHTPRHECGRG